MSLSDLKTDTLDQIYNDVNAIISGLETIILLTLAISLVVIFTFLIVSKNYVDPHSRINRKSESVLVSFFVSVRNEEKMIIECINSMLNQTYKKREIFVVDDASTDQTPKIIEETFGSDSEIKTIYLKKNVGKKRALANAFKESKVEIF